VCRPELRHTIERVSPDSGRTTGGDPGIAATRRAAERSERFRRLNPAT